MKKTLKEFLVEQRCEEALGDLLRGPFVEAIRGVRNAIERGDIGGADSENPSGEKQLKLDVQANDVFVRVFGGSPLVERLASEELPGEQVCNADGQFALAFDPLDGSSLADVNFAVGSILGVYPAGTMMGRNGVEQLAACIVVYGPRTTLILTVGNGTHEFTLEDGEFYLLRENLKITEPQKYLAPGNLRATEDFHEYRDQVRKWMATGLTLRYSGGMVPDISHILLKGSGVFSYPGGQKYPNGKLRLLFECAPIALLVEKAGGRAVKGLDYSSRTFSEERILDMQVTELHGRTQAWFGN